LEYLRRVKKRKRGSEKSLIALNYRAANHRPTPALIVNANMKRAPGKSRKGKLKRPNSEEPPVFVSKGKEIQQAAEVF